MAQGLAVYRRRTVARGTGSSTPLAAALALFSTEVAAYQRAGVHFDQDTLDALPGEIEHALDKYPAHDTLVDYEIIDVELDLGPDYGNARVDVLAKDKFGHYLVIDDKAKRKLEARWQPKELMSYEADWKMNHYVWAISDKLGVPIDRYYINLIVVTPRYSVTLAPYPAFQGKTRDWWEASARRLWNRMEQEAAFGPDFTPSMAVVHKSQYGKCPMWTACLDHGLDKDLMMVDYIQVERAH